LRGIFGGARHGGLLDRVRFSYFFSVAHEGSLLGDRLGKGRQRILAYEGLLPCAKILKIKHEVL
jgi:hypothetical protein